jgi:hypothetical protein
MRGEFDSANSDDIALPLEACEGGREGRVIVAEPGAIFGDTGSVSECRTVDSHSRLRWAVELLE